MPTKILVLLPEHAHATLLEDVAHIAQNRGANIVLTKDIVSALTESQSADAVIGSIDASKSALHTIKQANPNIALIGVHESPPDTLGNQFDHSYDFLLRNRCNVLLSLLPSTEGKQHRSLILTGERGIQPCADMKTAATQLVDIVQSRIGVTLDRTQLDSNGLPASVAEDTEMLLKQIREWAKLSLFPRYQPRKEVYPGAEFGFAAKRTAEGTLITSKTSNKTNATVSDLALVRNIEGNTLHVSSTGKPASLNASLAYHIFALRPEINYVVHSHIFLPEGVNVPLLTRPGTREDWQSIEPTVKSGARVINQRQHGTLILLEKPEDLLPILKANGVYQHQSELYDKLYERFKDSPEFLEALKGIKLPEQAKVLDLCCGTGRSTEEVRRALGMHNVDFADGSASMLAVAEKRFGQKGILARLEDLSNIADNSYDFITVRQAFSYVKPEDLGKVAQNISRILKPNGRFIFNGFAKLPAGTSRMREEDTINKPDMLVRTHEDNQITDTEILHSQRSEIIDFNEGRWQAVLDVNQFYQHTPEQLRDAFERQGMTFALQQNGGRICCIAGNRKLAQGMAPDRHASRAGGR